MITRAEIKFRIIELNQLLVVGREDLIRLFFQEMSVKKDIPYPTPSYRKGYVIFAFLKKDNYYVDKFLEENRMRYFDETGILFYQNRIYSIELFPPPKECDCEYVCAFWEWEKSLESSVEEDLKKWF